MANLEVVNEFLKEFESLPQEEKERRCNEEYSVEELEVLHDHGYNIVINDGRCNVEKAEKTEKG